MKLCFMTLGCPEWNLRQIAENGKKMGFDGVELRIGGDKHIDTAMTSAERLETRDIMAASGLDIAGVAGYTRFCGSDAETLRENGETLLRNAQLAADLGAPVVRTFMGEDGSFSEAGAETLRKYCDMVSGLGVTACIEIHDALKTGRMAARVLQSVDSMGLGVLWDIHHSVKAGEPPAETWASLGSSIKHMHFKDAAPDGRLCHMGEGVLPVREIIRILCGGGYSGYLSFEWEKMWHPELDEPEAAFPKYVEFMRAIGC